MNEGCLPKRRGLDATEFENFNSWTLKTLTLNSENREAVSEHSLYFHVSFK